MLNEKFIFDCHICGSKYQHGPHICQGHRLELYGDIICCDTCWKGNWDGWNQDRELTLLNHLKAKGLPIPPRNSKGFLPRH